MKQELYKDKTDTLRFTPYLNNRPVIASAATITLKRPDGTSLQGSTAATVNGTTGEITYALSSSLTADLNENYIAEWSYTVSGTTYYFTQLFDVVLHKLQIIVRDEDLISEQSDLFENSEGYSGTVDSSSNSTLVDDELKQFEDDRFNNGKVEIVNTATGAKQIRTVTDFVQSTGTLSVTPNWSANPDTTYSYVVRRGFAHKIVKAFDELMTDIRNKGFRPALIIESTAIQIPLVKKSLAIICKDFMKEKDDKWDALYKIYSQEYLDAMSKMVFQYDEDESGNIDDIANEKDRDGGSIRLRR